MVTYFSLKPLAAVLISLLAAILIVFSSQRPNLRETWTIIASLAKFGITLSMIPEVLAGKYPGATLITISPGISLALRVDTFGLFFALSASLLWIFTSFYSIGYMRGLSEHKQTRYFASFAICLSCTLGVAFAANLLTLIIFYEILTIATYPLVIHEETPEAISAGRKYLAYLLTGGVLLITAIAFTHLITGSLDFRPGGFLVEKIGEQKLMILFLLFLFGFGVKAAVMPLHSWLPTAMIAPTPVSALLHAVAVVKAGVFGILRATGFVFNPALMHEIGASDILAFFACATILLSSLLAMFQDNLKRRLAYSTVGHLSYILLGVLIIAPNAWLGGVFHIVAHAATKITLFFCAGAIYVKTYRENVSELNGIGQQMPITMIAFALASIGLVGLPPVCGFISKWFLIQGIMEEGQEVYAIVLLISGLLNAGYLFPIIYRAFFIPSHNFTKFNEAPLLILIPLMLTAALSILLCLSPDAIFHFYGLAANTAMSIIRGGGL